MEIQAQPKSQPKKRRRYTHLSVKQVDAIKKTLLTEKERILNSDFAGEEARTLDKNELCDPVDEANMNIQASQSIRFRNRENMYLKKINKTLNRINDADFGECNECGYEVGSDRLSARPTAEYCITCKEESEKSEKNNFFLKRSKSLGKTSQEMGSTTRA